MSSLECLTNEVIATAQKLRGEKCASCGDADGSLSWKDAVAMAIQMADIAEDGDSIKFERGQLQHPSESVKVVPLTSAAPSAGPGSLQQGAKKP